MTEDEVLKALSAEKPFETTMESGAFSIRVREYVPYVCTAVHAGHAMPKALAQQCLLNGPERFKEEDPRTDVMIDAFPITLIAHDSRYTYDLNRDPDHCIYEEAWDKKVWRIPPTELQKKSSLEKHAQYYRVLKQLLSVLEKKFGEVLLIDLHSYNWQIRKHKDAPVFKIGTKQVDVTRWKSTISTLEKKLSAILLPNLKVNCKRNVVFEGRGYQATFVTTEFSNTLIIPLEIKKIYMDEKKGTLFPLVLERLKKGLYLAVFATAIAFNKKLTRTKLKKKDLLRSDLEPVVLTVDHALFRLAKNFDTLYYVNPINLQQEKNRFFSKKEYTPKFRYRQLRIDPYDFRQKLYKVPIANIQDPTIEGLYRAVIDNYATKIEMLSSIGTPQFLYNSLRYYGEPGHREIENAQFILHAGKLPDTPANEKIFSAQAAKAVFQEAAKNMGFNCQVVVTNQIVAKAMVNNGTRELMVNRHALLSHTEVEALIHHELGVHMVTTLNAIEQPLCILKIGLPGNTYTQEGTAILSEYLSGNMTLKRLQELALRVLAVDMMVRGIPFYTVYRRLHEEHHISEDDAFSLTARVFRGGGFTKDYLYLSGFRDMLARYRTRDIKALLIGKTGAQFHDTLDSLIARNILHAPKYITPALQKNMKPDNPVLDYLVSSIK